MNCSAIVRVNMFFDPLRIKVDIIKEIVLLGNTHYFLIFFAVLLLPRVTWYVVEDSGMIFDQVNQFSWN